MNIQDLFNEALRDTQSGRLQAAEKKLLRLTQGSLSDEGVGNVQKLLGMVLASGKRFAEAAEAFGVALEKLPSDPSIPANLCSCLTHSGQLDEAVAAGRLAVERYPDLADGHFNLADALKMSGDPEGAIGHYRRTTEIDPSLAAAHSALGNILRDTGDLGGAVDSYRASLETAPDNAITHNNLGAALRDGGDAESALSSYRRAAEIRPDMAVFHSNMGMAYRDMGDSGNALTCFERALEIDPGSTRALIQRGHLYRDDGDFDRAIEDYERADTGVARAEALRCLYASGRYDEMFRRVQDAPDKYGTNVGASAICAFAAEQLGRGNPHPFCPDPLEYLYFARLDDHVTDMLPFTAALLDELKTLPGVWDPISTTTKSGIQTRGNLFDRKSENILALRKIIEREIEAYRAHFSDRDCLFIDSWPAESNFNSWSVRLQTNGHQNAHIHASGWLSGVVYLQLVASNNEDEGAIVFGSDGYGYPPLRDDVAEILHRPAVGDIVLFPSSLFHRTVPITKDGERIIVAFDLVPRTG